MSAVISYGSIALIVIVVLFLICFVKSRSERKDSGQESNNFTVRGTRAVTVIFTICSVIFGGFFIAIVFFLRKELLGSSREADVEIFWLGSLFFGGFFAMSLYKGIISGRTRIKVMGNYIRYMPPIGAEQVIFIDDIGYYTNNGRKLKAYDKDGQKLFVIEHTSKNIGELIEWFRKNNIKYDSVKPPYEAISNMFSNRGKKRTKRYLSAYSEGELSAIAAKTSEQDEQIKKMLEQLKLDRLRVAVDLNRTGGGGAWSKIGGKPDLPKDFVWDYYEAKNHSGVAANRPLAFLLQINCREIKEIYPMSPLPDKGLLSFFYELETMEWGPDAVDKGKYVKLYYFEDTESLVETDLPGDLAEDYHIPGYPLNFVKEESCPEYIDFIEEKGLENSPGNRALYTEACKTSGTGGKEELKYGSTFLFGHPESVQNYVFDDFENSYIGSRNIPRFELERMAQSPLSKSWLQILQLDSGIFKKIGKPSIMFGDAGIIYFAIRKNDLEDLNFEKTWFTLQCS